ncbi:MAG TPA: stage II sporulation protein M [Verrucomicrobiae bacterium]|jgi:uncharacterized membrane protein SpoIIM required for sporulation|nr:stage II sporulation protein M [Verrucomicrobiae bacterium]
MTQATFLQRRSPSWERLETLLDRAGRRGLRSLAPEEVVELGKLYRQTTSDLGYAQGRGYDANALAYLNRLTARAHGYVYGGNAEAGWSRIGRFFTHTFPREFRRSFAYFAICAALTVACAIVAYVIVRNHPGDAFALLPSSVIPPEIKKSLHDSNFAHSFSQSPEMSSMIITNNIKVTLMAFAGCITLGLFTIYIIAFNGLMVGALGALFTNAGFGFDFWATVAPHGVIELTAIQIAGGAGLLAAAGIIYPGRLRRRDAFRLNAQRAGVLVAGVACMLVVAGTIEGYFSPRRLPAETRVAFGAITAIALIGYLALAGRDKKKRGTGLTLP